MIGGEDNQKKAQDEMNRMIRKKESPISEEYQRTFPDDYKKERELEDIKRQAFSAVCRMILVIQQTIGEKLVTSEMCKYILVPYEHETDEYYVNAINILMDE